MLKCQVKPPQAFSPTLSESQQLNIETVFKPKVFILWANNSEENMRKPDGLEHAHY